MAGGAAAPARTSERRRQCARRRPLMNVMVGSGAPFLLVLLLLASSSSSRRGGVVAAWTMIPMTTTSARRAHHHVHPQHRRSSASTTTTPALFALPASNSEPTTFDGRELGDGQSVTTVGNFLLVQLRDALTATAGGLLLPDDAQETPTEGLVVAAGPGRVHPHTGVRIPTTVRPGQSVVYGKFDGTPVEYQGDDCHLVRDDNVLLVYDGVSLRLDRVECVRDYVLIELDDFRGGGSDGNIATSSGVVIAAQVLADDVPCTGRVVKVGPGRATSTGEYTQSPVQAGDYVKFKDYAGNDVRIEGKAYSVVKMVDILCTLREEAKQEAVEA